jgi:hypothetical protein
MSRTMTTCTRRVGRFRVSRPALLLLRPDITKKPSWVVCCRSLSACFHLHAIHDSVADCLCFGSGDGFAALCATAGNQHEECLVHRIPNDDRIADSVRAEIVLSQGRLNFGRARKHFCPTRHLRRVTTRRVWHAVPMLAYDLMLQKL